MKGALRIPRNLTLYKSKTIEDEPKGMTLKCEVIIDQELWISKPIVGMGL